MATEAVTCSQCQQKHPVVHCDRCQDITGERAVWFHGLNMPFDLQPAGDRPSNKSPVLCVPCARGQKGPVDLVALVGSPQQRYPDRVETLPTRPQAQSA